MAYGEIFLAGHGGKDPASVVNHRAIVAIYKLNQLQARSLETDYLVERIKFV